MHIIQYSWLEVVTTLSLFLDVAWVLHNSFELHCCNLHLRHAFGAALAMHHAQQHCLAKCLFGITLDSAPCLALRSGPILGYICYSLSNAGTLYQPATAEKDGANHECMYAVYLRMCLELMCCIDAMFKPLFQVVPHPGGVLALGWICVLFLAHSWLARFCGALSHSTATAYVLSAFALPLACPVASVLPNWNLHKRSSQGGDSDSERLCTCAEVSDTARKWYLLQL